MSTYCNRMFYAFQIYVAYVSFRYCKSRSGVAYVAMTIHVCCKCMFQKYVASVLLSRCCICCTGYTRILQVYVSNVVVVSNVCCRCFYMNVAYVTVSIHICCKHML
jgi:hypothetical protein